MVAQKAKVIISNLARASLRSHIEYLKKEVSEETAEYVKQGILAMCAELQNFSGYSKERYLEDESTDYRSVTQWNYNIIYTIAHGEVRVLNIIHTSLHPDGNRKCNPATTAPPKRNRNCQLALTQTCCWRLKSVA